VGIVCIVRTPRLCFGTRVYILNVALWTISFRHGRRNGGSAAVHAGDGAAANLGPVYKGGPAA